MLTEQQLSLLKNDLLNQQKEIKLTEEEASLVDNNIKDTTGELSMYDNHPADMGTELFEREKDLALSIHAAAELEKINNAIHAFENGSYGVCQTCGRDIPFERLKAVPYATQCVEHIADQSVPSDRPIEEEILQPPMDNSFAGRNKGNIRDYQDSFQEVAKHGTSETPSDFEGDFDNYNTLYDSEIKDGFTEEYEMFSATDISGEHKKVFPSEEVRKYENQLDGEEIESPIGDIPYKQTDGYVDDHQS